MVDETGLFTFNRRVVADQIVYVRAASRAEAWRKVRAEQIEDTSDDVIVKVSYRSTPDATALQNGASNGR